VWTGVRNVRVLTRVSLQPIPQWVALEGYTGVALMAEHDNAKPAHGQCACSCGALTRVRRACLWRAQRACATPLPQGGTKTRSRARGQRDVAVCFTNSGASAFVDAGEVRSSPLAAHRGSTMVSVKACHAALCEEEIKKITVLSNKPSNA